jgi:DNA repair protein RecO (recombination protein O)
MAAMALVHDPCICLFKTEYSETSQVLCLFSRTHGIVRVLAKGAHRRTKAGASRFDGGVDLLELGDAVFTHDPQKELAILTEWHLAEGRLGLRQNLRAIYLGLYAAELIEKLIQQHDPHPELFDQFRTLLPQMESARREEAFLAFELELLREAGYLPAFSTCVSCGSSAGDWPRAWFSPARGGILCRNCEAAFPDRVELDVRLLRLVQMILLLPRAEGPSPRLPRLSRHQTDPLNRMLADQVEHTLGRPLRLRRYIV